MGKVWNIIIAGVGGQGIVTVARILAESALASGYRVKTTDIVGGAQRGGAILSHVRFGDYVYSSIVPDGLADIVVGVEPLEALRISLQYLKQDGTVIYNERPVYPLTVQLKQQKYPSLADIKSALLTIAKKVFVIDASGLASSAGSRLAAGAVLLGFMKAVSDIPIPKHNFHAAIEGMFTEKVAKINIQAFEAGFSKGLEVSNQLE
ncbi:MAG: indolepyruvate oxidoreductase subunit beta [Nitrososphaerota archaeon]